MRTLSVTWSVAVGLLLGQNLWARDLYPNFAALAAANRSGVDYRITIERRGSRISVMAPHGGSIEPYSELLAREVAGDRHNLYVFEALQCSIEDPARVAEGKCKGGGRLHLTSSHFDEPQALALAAESQLCFSVHGFRKTSKYAPQQQVILVGGKDRARRERFATALRQGFPTLVVDANPPAYLSGSHPQNVVNRCALGGMQLELSLPVRLRLKTEPGFLRASGRVLSDLLAAESLAETRSPVAR